MNYSDLIKDFAKRTMANYEALKNGPFEVTQLINSSVGLLIFPEQKFFDRIEDDLISEDLLLNLQTATVSTYPEALSLQNLCRHMRNAIAHCGVELGGEHGTIQWIKLKDRGRSPKVKQHCTFEMQLSIDILKKFFFEFSSAIAG